MEGWPRPPSSSWTKSCSRTSEGFAGCRCSDDLQRSRRWSGARVLRQDDLEAFAVDVRVDLGGGDVRVPEHRLHGAQIGAALQEMGGEAVAQRVRMHVAQARGGAVAAEQLPESLPRHAPAAVRD